MYSAKHYCYICGKEITKENETDEHIILNAIGGHLHSYTVICKDCNTKMGETADAKLAEDFVDFGAVVGTEEDGVAGLGVS